MKKELGIDKKTFDAWRKGLKKKAAPPWSFNLIDDDSIKQSPTVSNNDDPIKNAFNSLFDARDVTYEDVWKITFPKIAEDLIDPDVFKRNVTEAVERFFKIYFPLRVEIEKGIEFLAETVSIDIGQFTGMYPEVLLKPSISGPSKQTEEFMRPIRQWNGFELYWKGSFLKSKSSGKIINIRLTGLSYNIPDKFISGQPASYVEKSII